MGLFLDLHGHNHTNHWTELGYLVNGDDLDNDLYHCENTSLRNLGHHTAGIHDFDDVLRGDVSYGHYLETEGFESVPSPTHPGPDGESYFSGGYNTQRHGSRDGGVIDGIHIESSIPDLLDYMVYGYHLAKTTAHFIDQHYP